MIYNIFKPLLPVFLLLLTIGVKAQIITTYAGTGIAGYTGDGGPATDGQLYSPYGLAVDGSGNLYIAEQINNIIRKVTPAGIISTYVGTGIAGYSGDGGQATNAKINTPYNIVIAQDGTLYFTDNGNNVIRKVSYTGIITTLPVVVRAHCPPHPIPSIMYSYDNPRGIALDDTGNIYLACWDRIVLKINTNDTARLFAGDCTLSYTGDGGVATVAALNNPMGVAVDHEGNVYIGDEGNNVVRKVNTSGIISRYAGNGAMGGFYGDGGSALSAGLFGPFGVTTDNAGNLYIQDIFNRRIRKVNTSGIITTVAGNGIAAYSGDGGPATDASFYDATGFAIDQYGNYYIADLSYSVVRKVTMLPLGAEAISIVNNNFILYPNPNKGVFSIIGTMNTKTREPVTVEVIDMLGHAVYKKDIIPQNGILDTQIILDSNLPNGIYLLHINREGEHKVLRFIIDK